MKILFLDRYCPGAFRLLSPYLAQLGHEVAFVSEYRRKEFAPQGMVFAAARPVVPNREDPRERVLLTLMRRGDAFRRALEKLKLAGFVPDLMVGNGADGSILYAQEVFSCPIVGYFPWYFSPETESEEDGQPSDLAPLRLRNMFQLDALTQCRGGVTGTEWQKRSYPMQVRDNLCVCHEGIDTEFFSPKPMSVRLEQNGQTLDLGGDGHELITYTARNLTANSGGDVLLKALPLVLEQRPSCHALVVARKEPDRFGGLSAALKTHPRVHFAALGGYEAYRGILRASHAHVFLSGPAMLSSSILEAMSSGCLVVAPDTEPLREVITHGHNGLLTAYPNPQALADTLCYALKNSADASSMRQAARKTVMEQFDAKEQLPIFADLLLRMQGA